MKILVFGIAGLFAIGKISGQAVCSSFEYQQQQVKANPALIQRIKEIEQLSLRYQEVINSSAINARATHTNVIKIPVVVHILYHYPGENISDLNGVGIFEVSEFLFLKSLFSASIWLFTLKSLIFS